MLGLAAYFICLVTVGIFHNRFFVVDVVFYASLFDVLVAANITMAVLYKSKCFRGLNPFELTVFYLMFLAMGYGYAISIPTVIDRSLSFYILEKTERMGGVREEALEEIISKDYLREFRVADLRLTEQISSGTIQIQNGCIFLSTKGLILVSVSGFIRKNLLPEKRLIRDKYSDNLLNPYEQDEGEARYKCTP